MSTDPHQLTATVLSADYKISTLWRYVTYIPFQTLIDVLWHHCLMPSLQQLITACRSRHIATAVSSLYLRNDVHVTLNTDKLELFRWSVSTTFSHHTWQPVDTTAKHCTLLSSTAVQLYTAKNINESVNFNAVSSLYKTTQTETQLYKVHEKCDWMSV